MALLTNSIGKGCKSENDSSPEPFGSRSFWKNKPVLSTNLYNNRNTDRHNSWL